MTLILRTTLTAVCLLILGQFAHAAEDVEKLKLKIQKRLPDISITEFRSAPIPGLYEMVFGTRVAYVSADGQFMFLGEIIDLESQRNLTAMRRGSLVLKSIDAMGESNMIVLGPAQPKRTITVFTDVDCPYCARLHNEVPALTKAGVKVRYLLYPRAGKDSQTYKRSVSVWCSKDRVKAVGMAKRGEKLDIKTCDNPVDQHVRLGQEVGVQGTPTIVLDDGRILPGYAPAGELLTALGLQDGKKAN